MKHSMGKFGAVLLAPLMCLGLVAGIAAENSTHLKPADVEPYHDRARKAVGFVMADGSHEGGTIKYMIGRWAGTDQAVPETAQKLLKPNGLLSRLYRDDSGRGASLLIVQCRDTRDMGGHYPVNCYPAHGQVLVSSEPRTWKLDGLELPGTEYTFDQAVVGGIAQMSVYNFLILPGPNGGIFRDIKGVNRASEDYQQRYYGAAQFQLVMSASLPREERDQIFQEIVGSNVDVIRVLRSTGAVNP